MKKLIKIFIALYYKIRFVRRCKIHIFTNTILGKCRFEGKNILGKGCYFVNSSLGYGSYIGTNGEFTNCAIGKYSSIGNNVKVVSATHPVDLISSHPAFYSSNYHFTYNKIAEVIEHLHTSDGFEAKIGNDVWIGDNVLIKGGITIGNGAVIAMGSVVTHDVAPYTIVAGVPARPIRSRFDEQMISKLQMLKWWDRSSSWIKEHASEFANPEKFISDYFNESDGKYDEK